MTSAETFRAREVYRFVPWNCIGSTGLIRYRYYQPKNLSDVPKTSLSLERDFTNHVLPKPDNFTTQQSFSDTALTAFTQLIALRLASQRAIVSLIDHENEYFLAESTSTLSLIDDEGPAQNAWLSISGARVPREKSLCEQTLRLVPNQDTTAEMTPWFLVPDLRLDEKMSKLDCVRGPPYLRFYCGVALTNKKGINIGCVYVVDDRARTDFSLEQAQFLTKMAATVMDHLENIRAKEDIVRVTMMSQALHAFIEGDGTMNGDWQRLKRYNLPSGAGVGFHWESNKNDGAGSYVNGKKELGMSSPTENQPGFLGPDIDANHGQSPLQHAGTNPDARYNFNNSPWSSSEEVPQVSLKSVFEGVEEAAAALTGGRDTEFINSGFSNLLHTTFSRASNLVREGMEVDGAVFFDAPFKFYQGRSTLETDPRRSSNQNSESSSESDDEHSDARPGPRPHVTSTSHHTSRTSSHHPSRTSSRMDTSESRASSSLASAMGLKSEILGYSTLNSSSWNNQTNSQITNFTAIDQSLLTSLVRRYPQGELFVFDQDGPISPPPEATADDGSQATITPSVDEKQARHRARKRAEILRLLVAFPRARQIFFVPLYDSTSGCFIGSFAWSTSATRIFSIDNHLSYLIAFGHSVMSEVSRLNTLSADNAKGDFISNVSHELRSPLHGILASVEFLADTALDGFQRNLVDTVDICGRTLLDTIEHVLDFSKIKKFGQETVQPMGVVSDLDISAVIEEVLEGVHAGYEFNGLSSQGLADTTKSRRAVPSSPKENDMLDGLQFGVNNDLLTVIIDIDFRDSWQFPTVPGTWRRLTMNIFGNALKYTKAGYIRIKLEARAISSVVSAIDNNPTDRTMVTLTISDTGRGMSSDFLKTKVFMPFSQV
jgi:signal transduction histidine kinase